jgi:hypothetical protein
MITTGSKHFFGIGTVLILVAICYLVGTEVEFNGSIVLFFVGGAFVVLGIVTSYTRDAEVDAPAVQSASAADVEGLRSGGTATAATLWPLLGAVGVIVTILGLVLDKRVFLGGVLLLAAATVEWAVQGWADRASGDPAYNASVRARLMHPFEFPILGAAAVVLVIFGFSRVMLAVNEHAAIWVFVGVGALVLVVAAVLSVRPRIPKGLMVGVLVLGAAVAIVAGIVGAAHGEREIEAGVQEGNEGRTSNVVGDKSNSLAVRLQAGADKLPNLVMPKGVTIALLFDNETDGPRRLVIDTGATANAAPATTTTAAEGQEPAAATAPPVFRTDFIGEGKTQFLPVTMPKSGSYTYRTEAGDGVDVVTGTLTVP